MQMYGIILISTLCLTMTWVTIAFAQVGERDGDGFDDDELSAPTLLVGLAALAVIGWILYRGRSRKSR